MVKKLDAAIQIADGTITCPHCAGELALSNAIGAGEGCIMLTMQCVDCNKLVGLELASCANDVHTHITWFDLNMEDIRDGHFIKAPHTNTAPLRKLRTPPTDLDVN